MGEINDIQVTVLDEPGEYPKGVSLEKIAEDFQARYPHRIIMARVNGKLRELHKTLDEDALVEFVTTGEKIGEQAYRRTATLMLTKAVTDVMGKDAKLVVQFSMHKGYYCEIKDRMPIDADVLKNVGSHMKDLAEQNIPIIKHTVSTREAAEIFKANGMQEKARLLKYRRASRVNMYQLEDISDYYYGYMAPSTGYISRFELIPYREGFVIQMPTIEAPEIIQEFKPSENVSAYVTPDN